MKKIYTNVKILDGTKDMTLKENMVLVVEDGIISEIKENDGTIQGEDLNGQYLIPGLINLHVHTPGSGFPKKKQSDSKKLAKIVMSNPIGRAIGLKISESSVKTQLLSGTTTIRTVGGLGNFDSKMRDLVNENKIIGPRIFSCDQAVTIPDGHMEGSVAYGAKSDEEFIKFVEDNAASGVDWIKIMVTGGCLDAKVRGEPGEMKMNAHQVKICCDKAHELGLKVCAHVESPKGVEVAVYNGVDSIEHGAAMSKECLNLMKERGAVLVSTSSPAIPLAKMDPKLTGASEVQVYNTEVLLEGIIEGTRECLKNGIVVGLGTDTVCPYITHYDMWRELEYFHRLIGVSRNFALHTATLVNASILGIEKETGSIEVGKSADFMIVENNPLDGFDTIRNPKMVVFKGKEYKNPKVKKSPLAEEELDKVLATL